MSRCAGLCVTQMEMSEKLTCRVERSDDGLEYEADEKHWQALL